MTHQDTEAVFETVVDAVAGRARRGQMMGRPTIAVDRKLAACLSEGVLGIRLGAGTPAFAAAMSLAGATIFTPGDGSRGFADWVALPVDQAAHWLPNVVLAIERLEALATTDGTNGG